MVDVSVHLQDGPQEGRQVDVAADSSGRPAPRVMLPAPPPADFRATPGQRRPQLIYERARRRRDGTWEFRYVGAELD